MTKPADRPEGVTRPAEDRGSGRAVKRRTRITEKQKPGEPGSRVERDVQFVVLDGELTGQAFRLVVYRDRRIRIPFKPRGANMGWSRIAVLRDNSGRQVYAESTHYGRQSRYLNLKNVGCDWMLAQYEATRRSRSPAAQPDKETP